MTPKRYLQAVDLFHAACGIDAEHREDFLAQACNLDEELRLNVALLLKADQRSDTFLKGSPDDIAAGALAELHAERVTQTHIGKYRILRVLGEGGMGVVYEVEQDQPRRVVALKVIKADVAAPQQVRRFEQEFQALARLQHPGIAQVYEAGTIHNRFGPQPYFSMELIRGKPLLQYIEAHQLNSCQKLALMAEVCEAVHHAHQRGIIHRDLKPTNILVDERGQPKILDLGVAKVINTDVACTRHSDAGELVGTLTYMSPEQVSAGPTDLDARSDVYALGVILFELLSGMSPYKIGAQLQEAMRTICETEPASLGAMRREYRGDIETIVSKALEKDKQQRYSSAAEFAADIHRYFHDEPILARRPATTYKLRKFVRRNRILVAGVSSVVVVLIAGVIASTSEATIAKKAEQRALQERDRAAAAEQAATIARNRALEAEHAALDDRNRALSAEALAIRQRNRAELESQRAEQEAAKTKAINDFVQNDLLSQAGATAQAGLKTIVEPDLKVRTALDRAATRVESKFVNDPLIEASIRQTIANTYKDLGLYADAQRQMERGLDLREKHLPKDDSDTLSAMNDLCDIDEALGKYTQAESLCTYVLNFRRRHLGYTAPETLTSLSNLATVYADQGKYAQAEPLALQSYQLRQRVLGAEAPAALVSANELAVLYSNEGKYDEAEQLGIQILTLRKRLLGEKHPATLISTNNLAMVLLHQGKYSEAEVLFRKLVEARCDIFGKQHPDTLVAMNNLAAVCMILGRCSESEQVFTEILAIRRRTLGEQHPSTLKSVKNLALVDRVQGKYAESEALFSQVIDRLRGTLGDGHPDTRAARHELAVMYYNQGAYEAAEPLLASLLTLRRGNRDSKHEETASVLALLGQIRLAQKKYAEAESLFREALSGEEISSRDTWDRYHLQSMLGVSLAAQNQFAEAERLLIAGWEGIMRRKTTIPWENRGAPQQAGERIVELYNNSGNPEKAAEWRQKISLSAPPNSK